MKTIIWDGWDCLNIADLIDHWDWSHKDTVLIVKNDNGIVYVPKGETVELDAQGRVIGKIDETLVECAVVKAAHRAYLNKK